MQIMRSSRGMLVAGAVLAIAAFILVVVLLQQKSNGNSSPTPTATPVPPGFVQPTATPFVAEASVTATVGPSVVQAIRKVPAGTKLTSDALVRTYFTDQPVPPSQQIPSNAVTSIEQWEADTNVISGTIFIGTLLITTPVAQSKPLLQGDYAVLPIPPPLSLSYRVDPGHVAEAIQLSVLQADDYQIQQGDFVDLLLTIRQHEVDSLLSNPPVTTNSGPMETQEIVANAKVVATAPGGIFVVQLPVQDALVVKYVKDTGGNVDMVLVSASDVKNQNPQPKTNPVVPEYFLTPAPAAKGIPGLPTQVTPTAVNGVPYPLATPHPTATPAR